MSIDMLGTVDDPFNTQPPGGVTLVRPAAPGYYDYENGGVWVEPGKIATTLPTVNIQPAGPKTMEILVSMGGTANPRDVRSIHINDGATYLYPEDTGRAADILEFSDGLKVRQWRVMHADNRPWHNYCKAIVERIRGSDGR